MTGTPVGLAERPCVLLGAGGHAKVVADVALAMGVRIMGVCDPVLAREGVKRWQNLDVLGGDDFLSSLSPDEVLLLNGVGYMPGSSVRAELFRRQSEAGFCFQPLIHPSAWVSASAVLEDGVQVMAGAVVQAGVRLGANSILNTRSSLDHDCLVGASVHVAPGVTVCGNVRIDDLAFIGAGATIIQGVHVGANGFVKAGTTVSRDLV
ncbi:MAG: acetyltransferase [Pseudomonadota bacterium]|nr:acetyltransferase [Pseudomonadota bacterium]